MRLGVRRSQWALALSSLLLGSLAGCDSLPKDLPGQTVSQGDLLSLRSVFPSDQKPDSSPRLYLATARVHEKKGNWDKAISAYKKAEQLDENNPEIQLGLARVLDRMGKLAQAEKRYRRLLRKHPEMSEAWNSLGMCFSRQGRWEEALPALRQATELAPSRKLYHNNLGIALVKLGRTREALKQFSHTVGDAAAHYNVGYLLVEQGEDLEAAHQFLLASLKDPNMESAHAWLDKLATRKDVWGPHDPADAPSDKEVRQLLRLADDLETPDSYR